MSNGAADGAIERVSAKDGELSLVGWATDARHRRIADRVLVFADGRHLKVGTYSLAKLFGQRAKRGGYLIAGSGVPPGLVTAKQLRVVAIVGGRGAVLKPASAKTFASTP